MRKGIERRKTDFGLPRASAADIAFSKDSFAGGGLRCYRFATGRLRELLLRPSAQLT
jgi:hypothetical protein